MDSPYDLFWAGIGNPDEQCKASAVEHPGDVRLRQPEWNVDIRTVRARQGSNTQETCCPLDDPFILVTYPHFICIANSFSTKKEDTHTGYPHKSEHETGFEPATLALARRYSTTEPLVRNEIALRDVSIIPIVFLPVNDENVMFYMILHSSKMEIVQ